jgi:hypothetical protein
MRCSQANYENKNTTLCAIRKRHLGHKDVISAILLIFPYDAHDQANGKSVAAASIFLQITSNAS